MDEKYQVETLGMSQNYTHCTGSYDTIERGLRGLGRSASGTTANTYIPDRSLEGDSHHELPVFSSPERREKTSIAA